MPETKVHIHLDHEGVVRVGKAGVPLDEVVKAFRYGNTHQSVRERFPMLSLEEIEAAVAYKQDDADAGDRGPVQRDADWRRWRATATEEMGTDVTPNKRVTTP